MKTIIVDTTKEDTFPIITSKENDSRENGYLMVEVMVAENKEYSGRVIKMGTNGKYTIELLEEL